MQNWFEELWTCIRCGHTHSHYRDLLVFLKMFLRKESWLSVPLIIFELITNGMENQCLYAILGFKE